MTMNATSLATVLLTPWRTTRRPLRWLTVGIFGVMSLVSLWLLASHPDAWPGAVVAFDFGVGYLWAFLFSTLLLVAMHARQTRTPGVERTVAASLVVYALAMVIATALAVAVAGGDAASAGLMTALTIAAALTFVLVPRYVAIFFALTPALATSAKRFLAIPMPGEPGFLAIGSSALVLLVVLVVWRWHRLLIADSDSATGITSPMVLQFGRGNRSLSLLGGGLAGWGATGANAESDFIAQRAGWRRVHADLRGVGPQAPVKALRVALGGFYVPQTLLNQLLMKASIVLPMLLFVVAMMLLQLGDGHGDLMHRLGVTAGVSIVGWVGTFGGLLIPSMCIAALVQRWRRSRAELPLLALLPGLGSPRAARRSVLRAALTRPLVAHALLLTIVIVAALAMHGSESLIVWSIVVQLGCAATAVCGALVVLGGVRFPAWAAGLALTLLFLLVSASVFAPVMTDAASATFGAGADVVLGALWLVAAAFIGGFGWRGWQCFRAQPHPFLIE